MDKCVPKIRARKLPHPEIDQETRTMMEEARRIKIQMVNGVEFVNNKRRLIVLRERIKERWVVKKNQMWKDLVDKADKRRHPREYWKEIGRMLGRKRKIRTKIMKNENGVELKTREEIERAFGEDL